MSSDIRKPTVYMSLDTQDALIVVGEAMHEDGVLGLTDRDGDLKRASVIKILIDQQVQELKKSGRWDEIYERLRREDRLTKHQEIPHVVGN